MREMSVAEQRYQAVLAVVADGRSVAPRALPVSEAGNRNHTRACARVDSRSQNSRMTQQHRAPVSRGLCSLRLGLSRAYLRPKETNPTGSEPSSLNEIPTSYVAVGSLRLLTGKLYMY